MYCGCCRVVYKQLNENKEWAIEDQPPLPESERKELEALVQDILEHGPPSERTQQPPSEGGMILIPVVQEVNISSSRFQKRCDL